jgi:Holliday junction resolvase RusA-like endonuclease
MPKRPLTFKVRIPEYRAPRTAWRRSIHRIAAAAMRERGITYRPEDRLEINLRLYLAPAKLAVVDVDNRLKDAMDALQGHVGGGGRKHRALGALIPNDSQIWRATVEKAPAPAQSKGFGHLSVRKYRSESR